MPISRWGRNRPQTPNRTTPHSEQVVFRPRLSRGCVRFDRAPVITLAILAQLALFTACGSGGGGTGAAGGNGGDGGGATTTSSGTGTTTNGPRCMDLCTELNKCPAIPSSNCATDCPPVETFVDDGMCRDAYTAAVACIIASPDPCKASDNDCIEPYAEFVSCTNAYCMDHPSEPLCQ